MMMDQSCSLHHITEHSMNQFQSCDFKYFPFENSLLYIACHNMKQYSSGFQLKLFPTELIHLYPHLVLKASKFNFNYHFQGTMSQLESIMHANCTCTLLALTTHTYHTSLESCLNHKTANHTIFQPIKLCSIDHVYSSQYLFPVPKDVKNRILANGCSCLTILTVGITTVEDT